MTVCGELKEHSIYIRDWKSYKAPTPNEDAFTEWLIYDLTKQLTSRVLDYKRFTRREESKNGADWDWVFIFDSIVYLLRVQAKVLDNKNNYGKIHYPRGSATQIKNLIHSASISGAIPVYAFYTGGVSITNCCKSILNEGVYIASAGKIHSEFVAKPCTRISKDDLSKFSFPLSCLACCADNFADSTGEKFGKFLGDHLYEAHNDQITTFQLTTLPGYIRRIINSTERNLPELFEHEFEHQIKGLEGVLIFKLSHK